MAHYSKGGEKMNSKKFKVSRVFIYTAVILIAVFCLLPMILVLVTSFTSEAAILKKTDTLSSLKAGPWRRIRRCLQNRIRLLQVTL